MDTCGRLKEGDEILEVNRDTLVGVSHDRAIDIVRQAAGNVTIVVCRTKEKEESFKETSSEAGK